MADGLSNADIAARLFVTVATVKTHVNHIFTKLGVTSRVEAVLAYQRDLTPSP
jgi:DNA-binding NarL/FixJ family response regulator